MRIKFSMVIFTLFAMMALAKPEYSNAQACPASIPIDIYECGTPINNTCAPPRPANNRRQVDCSQNPQNGECRSTQGWCSSNDSCVFAIVEGERQCYCTNSRVDCNQGSNNGGCSGNKGIGEACGQDCECSSGRCSPQRGICIDAGGFVCPSDPVYCPAGTVRSAVVTGTQCLNPKCTAGSAQTIGACCSGYWQQGACSDWYDCPTKSNPNKVCRDCEPDVFMCTSQEYVTYQCNPVCTATSPSNVVVTPISLTSSRVTWTPGVSNIGQAIYVSTSKSSVESNCTTGSCVIADVSLTKTQNSYTTAQVLSPGSVYYYRVVSLDTYASCMASSSTKTALLSCSHSPTSLSLSSGQTAVITSNIGSSSEIQRVDFASSDTSIATVSPTSDTTYPYTTTVTAVATGSVTISSTAYYTNGSVACQTGSPSYPGSQNTSVTVINSTPWWQVKDGDVQSGGNITSSVPAGNLFDTDGAGGYPGVPVYSGSTNLSTSNISSENWIAQSATTGAKLYNYTFFKNQIPADTVITNISSSSISGSTFQSGGTLSYGYYWYRYTGVGGLDLTINSPVNLGSRRVVLLVDNADLRINGNINLLDGVGFFGTFVNGDISLTNSAVTDLEGIYMADGSFSSGNYNTALKIRGSVATYSGFNLARDLSNNSLPGELFEYAPDQIILFPSKLSARKINWKEVAP